MNRDKMYEAYRKYLQTQCSYWSPQNEQYLAGEIVFQWSNREGIRRETLRQQAEMMRSDGVLSGLLYEMKKKLSRPGRNGRWSAWLTQQKIPRSTADRLILEHAEYFNMADELPRRTRSEPLEGNICQAAFRAKDRLKSTLRTPKSRMTFIKVLADVLGLDVALHDNCSVTLDIRPLNESVPFDCHVPNVIRILEDGRVVPVDYELVD